MKSLSSRPCTAKKKKKKKEGKKQLDNSIGDAYSGV
jgi:hypothetical protein